MPEHVLALPPRWEKDLDCGWVVFKSGKDDIRGYFAKPNDGRNLPAIVMSPENLGVIEHRQDVTRRLAKAGYAALTVDPYSRIGGQSPRDFTSHEERRIKATLATPDEQVVPDLQAAADYLAALPEVDSDRIGAIGYCSGGGQLYAWICGRSRNVKCAVVYYGAPMVRGNGRADGKDLDRALDGHKLQMPILVHHGDADKSVALSAGQHMVEALKKSGQPVEFYIYPGADHAFHDDSHPQYHETAALESWHRTLAFFDRYLKAPSTAAAAPDKQGRK
jgi:carboxymethylenebutenolidase